MDKYLFKVKIKDITRLSTSVFPIVFIFGSEQIYPKAGITGWTST